MRGTDRTWEGASEGDTIRSPERLRHGNFDFLAYLASRAIHEGRSECLLCTSRCESATRPRHCCSQPTVIIARPAVRLAAAPCFLKPQEPCGHGPWVCVPRADVIIGGGEESTLICWRRCQHLAGRSEKVCAIERAPHRIRKPDGSRDGIVGNQAFKHAVQALQALPGIARRPHSTEAICPSPALLLRFVAFLAATLSINQNCHIPVWAHSRLAHTYPPRALWLNKVAPHYSSS
jgi:hypothetical protein